MTENELSQCFGIFKILELFYKALHSSCMLDPATHKCQEWHLPGSDSMPYAIYSKVDVAWLSDSGSNALVKFDPTKPELEVFPLSAPNANVRQILDRPGDGERNPD